MPQWTSLCATTRPEHAELVAQFLLDVGCEGTQIDDRQIVLDDSEDASWIPRDEFIVTGYLPPGIAPVEAIAALQSTLDAAQIAVDIEHESLDDTDWSTSWRENFPPLEIGRFLIVPSWENVEVEENERIVLQLDPGLAFGTGQHPTTRMCLELLGEYVTEGALQCAPTKPNLLDVGCGSGILSIAAAKLGANVTASDLDHWCVQASLENAAQNKVQIRVEEKAGADWTEETFDFVVANLMSDLLILLAPQLAARCHAQSTLVVSGISSPRADEVEAALHHNGFATTKKREQNGETRGDYTESWTAFVMNRAAP